MGTKKKPVTREERSSSWRFVVLFGGALFFLLLSTAVALWMRESKGLSLDFSAEEYDIMQIYLSRYNRGERNFLEKDLDWMATSGHPTVIVVAASCYFDRKDYEKVIELLHPIREQLEHSDANSHSIGYYSLCSSYKNLSQRMNTIECTQQALRTRKSHHYFNKWYGMWISSLVGTGKPVEAKALAIQCIKEADSIPNIFPEYCYLQAGTMELLGGDIKVAMTYLYELFTTPLQKLATTESPSFSSIPLGIEPIDSAIKTYRQSLIVVEDLAEDMPLEGTHACSDQPWPMYFTTTNETKYHQTEPEYEMGCFDDHTKIATLSLLKDVLVYNKAKKTIHYGKNGEESYFYISGFPYPNSNSFPTIPPKLPTIHLQNVIMLHFLDTNFYHFTIEAVSKLILLMHHPGLNSIPELKILVPMKPFSTELLKILGFTSKVVPYDYENYNYEISNLFVIDWRIIDPPERPKLSHEDYYLPPAPILQFTRLEILSKLPQSEKPRNLVIFFHRKKNISRSVTDFQPMYEMVERVVNEHGFEFWIHGMEKFVTLEEQMEKFSRTVVLLGVHGAGLSNLIYTPDNTSVIEFTTSPVKVSVYSRMASIFSFPYYHITDSSFYYFTVSKLFPQAIINETETTLRNILPKYRL